MLLERHLNRKYEQHARLICPIFRDYSPDVRLILPPITELIILAYGLQEIRILCGTYDEVLQNIPDVL